MKEIDFKEINNYYNTFDLFKAGTIALAKDNKEINGLTIGWGGLGYLWRKPCCTVYVNKIRYSKHIFDNAEYFSVCVLPSEFASNVKYYGTVSGRDENKIQNGGLEVEYYQDVPYFKESNLVIICKKIGQNTFDINNIKLDEIIEWYKKDGPHSSYYGEIIKVLVK